MSELETLNFLNEAQVRDIAEEPGTPSYVYSEQVLREQAGKTLDFPAPFGLTVRYAMKANPAPPVLEVFDQAGLEIDASSGYEAERAIAAGVKPDKIMLTTQQLPDNLKELVEKGVLFNASSRHQLNVYGQLLSGSNVSVRFNPGLGSGHSHKVSTGGPAASFGIWHEYIEEVKEIAERYDLTINKIHTHIGAGTDPAVWQRAADLTLDIVHQFPEVASVNLGGGFKVARMDHEVGTDIATISQPIKEALESFAHEDGRKLDLEIEPGTFLTANAGSLVARVVDVKDTGEAGFDFLVLNTGMTEILRPTLYGAQHPIVTVNNNQEHHKYVVVGHCCESSDLLTPFEDDPEAPNPRLLNKTEIGDVVVIEGVGAYCAAMSAKGYNSFPPAAEMMLAQDGQLNDVRQ